MGRNWRIEKAAAEQQILFPSSKELKKYLERMEQQGKPYEIISYSFHPDNSLTVVIRNRYNNNAFLSRGIVKV